MKENPYKTQQIVIADMRAKNMGGLKESEREMHPGLVEKQAAFQARRIDVHLSRKYRSLRLLLIIYFSHYKSAALSRINSSVALLLCRKKLG